MTLKMDFQADSWELRYFLDEVAEDGVVVSVSTAGSGVAMDAVENLATVEADASGAKPLGVLHNIVADVDLTKHTLNWHKYEVNKGDKVALITKGWVVTDKVLEAEAGADAYLAASGNVTSDDSGQGVKVGRFRTGQDEDGFATLYIDL